MQIELIGCTSAGKSSLARDIQIHHLHDGLSLVTSYEFALQWAHLDWIKIQPVRMLFLTLIALFVCLLTWRKNYDFMRFMIGVIWKLPANIGPIEKLKIARIAARNLGIHEIVCRSSPEGLVILADEGTLHIANYLFVHVSTEPDMKDLETFIRLVPLPDTAVYLREPEPVLVARTKTRGHKRIPGNAPTLVDRFIKHSLVVFETLTKHSRLDGRLLIVEEGEVRKPAWGHTTSSQLEFARQIIEKKAGGGTPVPSVSLEEIS